VRLPASIGLVPPPPPSRFHDTQDGHTTRSCGPGVTTLDAATTSVLHDGHPLHTHWHRYVAVVALGPVDGAAAAAALAWAPRSSHPAVWDLRTLLPRRVLVPLGVYTTAAAAGVGAPLECGAPVARVAAFDALVCVAAVGADAGGTVGRPGTTAPFWRQAAGAAPGAPPSQPRTYQLGPHSVTHTSTAAARAVQLAAIVQEAVAYEAAGAWVDVLSPTPGAWIRVDQAPIVVRVNVHDFTIPGDGCWALIVNGAQVCRCVYMCVLMKRTRFCWGAVPRGCVEGVGCV
jgi:hypothetical protein